MGDRRFEKSYERVKGAADRAGAIHALSDVEVIEALAHSSHEGDPLIANVLATEAANRMERARAIYENITDGLCSVDGGGRIVSINPAAEEMLGWSHNALIGKEMHAALCATDEKGRPIPRDKCKILRVLRTGEVSKAQRKVLTRKDNTKIPVSFTAAPVKVDGEMTGLVIAFRDSTQLELFEQEKASWLNLVDSFYAVHDELGMGTLIVDDGRIHFANESFRQLFGYSLTELTSEVADVFALFPPEDRDSFKSHLADLYIHGTTKLARKARLLRRDARVVDAEIWVAKVNHQPGKISRLVFVVRPIMETPESIEPVPT